MTQMKDSFSEETLHAFIDGELPAARAAVLVRALAKHPELAEKVAELTALKGAVQESCTEIPCPIPDLDKIFAEASSNDGAPGGTPQENLFKRWLRASRIPLGLSGGLLAAVVAGGLFAGWLGHGTHQGNLTEQAIRLHQQWLEAPQQQISNTGPVQLADLRESVPGIYIPDLRASKLRISHLERFGIGGIHVGYVGTRSCHLSLFIRPTGDTAPLPVREQLIGKDRVFAWRVNRFDYVLLAVGMDQGRLELIASDVAEATRLLQPFDQTTELALRLNRQQSQACVG